MSSRRRGAVLLALGLYATLLAVGPLLHHDFACHAQTPSHCAACVASPSAPRAPERLVLEPQLTDLGGVTDHGLRAAWVQAPRLLPARSPPA